MDSKQEIIELMLKLEEKLNAYGGVVGVVGTPPPHLNQATFERLKNGTLFPNQPGSRAWGLADLADVVGFLARDWRN